MSMEFGKKNIYDFVCTISKKKRITIVYETHWSGMVCAHRDNGEIPTVWPLAWMAYI